MFDDFYSYGNDDKPKDNEKKEDKDPNSCNF